MTHMDKCVSLAIMDSIVMIIHKEKAILRERYLHEEFESSIIHLSRGSGRNITTYEFDVGNIG